MSWYKIELTVEQMAAAEMMKIQDQFEALFMSLGAPKDMALFADAFPHPDSESGKIREPMYFSPGAHRHVSALIETYSGVPCEKPTADSVALLVGHADAWELLK